MTFRSGILILLLLVLAASASAQDKKVLAEIFANVNCNNCRVPDDQFLTFANSTPDIQLLYIHNSNTDVKDPFYVAANPSADNRDKYYSGNAGLVDPVAFINGYYAGDGSNSEPQWQNAYNARGKLALIPITRSISSDGVISFNFTVNAANPAKVFLILKESKIIYHNTEAYGTMPGDIWNDIFREALPTATGSPNFIGSKTFSIQFDTSTTDWNIRNMEAIALVQDVQESSDGHHSHPIEAMGIVRLVDPAGVSTPESNHDRLVLSSNPMPQLSHVGISLSRAASARAQLIDMMGRMVQTFADQPLPQGETSVQIEGRPIPAGCYLLQLLVNGQVADQQKVIVE
jgi:hypothetical protein